MRTRFTSSRSPISPISRRFLARNAIGAIEEAVTRYAKRLEHYAREAPSNWFNFHDFWTPAGVTETSSRRASFVEHARGVAAAVLAVLSLWLSTAAAADWNVVTLFERLAKEPHAHARFQRAQVPIATHRARRLVG